MKVVQVNATCGVGSTGKICVAISDLLRKNGNESHIYYTLYSTEYPHSTKYSSTVYEKIQALKSRIFGNSGFNSHLSALRLVAHLKKEQPDIVHLHNIHAHDCNLNILFRYLKKHNVRVFWTFHDCWAFTGNCTHFTFAQCDKWKEQCGHCPQIRLTSWFLDNSMRIYRAKKRLFSDLDLTIITPSQWLADLVKQSFLKEHPVHVINNGIDLNVFKPCDGTDVRTQLGIREDEYMVLGVSFGWSVYKGVDVFVRLASELPEQYKIVLVGTDAQVDRELPDNVISVHRTTNQAELAQIYGAADVFVNATREENYPTVHLESLACGTPVVSFDTGGCKEMLTADCGKVVPTDDVDALRESIIDACERAPFATEKCVEQAQNFNKDALFEQYLDLYKTPRG